MRPADLNPLNQPYDGPGRSSDEAFADQIGAAVPGVRRLAAELWSDIDADSDIFGFGWWFPHPGTQRRILISDYLLRCVESIETNLIEARIHLLEAQHAFEVEDAFMARAVDYDDDGRAQVKAPPRMKGADDLGRILRDLHIAGFFRAVGSSLDCVAASVVGVLGLKLDIKTAGFTEVRNVMREIRTRGAAGQLRKPVSEAVRSVDTGPHAGWLDWTLACRNTLVHRARPLQFTSPKPEPTLHRPGRPVPYFRTTSVTMMSRNPASSDVELLRTEAEPVLTEDARITLPCVFDEARSLIDTVGDALATAWLGRRQEPDLIVQPPSQWPDPNPPRPSGFAGCRPGSEPYNPGLATTGPDLVKRMKAASLFDHQRDGWKNFD